MINYPYNSLLRNAGVIFLLLLHCGIVLNPTHAVPLAQFLNYSWPLHGEE